MVKVPIGGMKEEIVCQGCKHGQKYRAAQSPDRRNHQNGEQGHTESNNVLASALT